MTGTPTATPGHAAVRTASYGVGSSGPGGSAPCASCVARRRGDGVAAFRGDGVGAARFGVTRFGVAGESARRHVLNVDSAGAPAARRGDTSKKSTSRMGDGHETDAGDVHSGKRCAR